MPIPYSFAAALILASVYVFGYRLRSKVHHRLWVSIAAGVSVSTIFIDLLPEISESQARFLGPGDHVALFPEQAIYLAAMLGFVLFYGLQHMVATSASENGDRSSIFSSVQIAAFAAYSALIAYLLVHSVRSDFLSLALYCLAMAFHLRLVDHALAMKDADLYKRRGRWVLAGAVISGWVVAIFTPIPEQWLARITGFICGGVIMNTLVVELPEGRGGRFWPFVFSSAAYSLVLIFALK